jgi:hypothetical protein
MGIPPTTNSAAASHVAKCAEPPAMLTALMVQSRDQQNSFDVAKAPSSFEI